MAVQTRLFLPFMPNVQYANLKCTLASFAELLTRRMPDKVLVGTERTAKEFDFRFDASGIEQGKNPATVRFYLDDVHFSSIEFEDYGNGIVKAAMTADVSISYAKPVFVEVILPFIEDLFIKEAETLAKNEQNTLCVSSQEQEAKHEPLQANQWLFEQVFDNDRNPKELVDEWLKIRKSKDFKEPPVNPLKSMSTAISEERKRRNQK